MRGTPSLQELLQCVDKELSEVVVARIEREVSLTAVNDQAVLVALGVVALVGVHVAVDPLLDGNLADALNTEDVLKLHLEGAYPGHHYLLRLLSLFV